MSLLIVNNLTAGYGNIEVVFDVNLRIVKNQIVTILGSNGSGKSTILKVICGYLKNAAGNILFNDKEIMKLEIRQRVELGVILVPEGKLLFPNLTVLENLKTGAMTLRAKEVFQHNLEQVYNLFPVLKERQAQSAETLSGGEQQMVAIGRGLMSQPSLLMLDEPSLGLAPLLVKEVFRSISEIKEKGITVLLVEQNVTKSLGVSNYAYIVQNGLIKMSGKSGYMADNPEIQKAYMGL